MPSPLRGDDDDTIWGLPGLIGDDLKKVQGGNATALFAIEIFHACLNAGLPCVIENPLTSRLWKIPQIRDLLDNPQRSDKVKETVFNHCGYGSDFCKPTKLLSCNIDLSRLARRCNPRPFWTFTGKKHCILSGIQNGIWSTATASAYPIQFCNQFAKLLVDHLSNIK